MLNRIQIAQALGVNPNVSTFNEINSEIHKRVGFIKNRIIESGVRSLVLGISGGVDSLTAGRLCQLAINELKEEGQNVEFIAVRLPYQTQKDEQDAQLAISFIKPDRVQSVDIKEGVDGIMGQLYKQHDQLSPTASSDFVKGNIKARIRMVAQYALANMNNGLVVGTDHAAEAVMGFFTKFGDGACDIAPLSGLVKSQVRKIAASLGAPEILVEKVPTADLEDLFPGKPDEVAYGCSYEDIDNFLLGGAISEEVERMITDVYLKTQHKRQLPYVPV
ncbi:ammonia-dependent NAD(+) synthetase [Pseudomonas luteola]